MYIEVIAYLLLFDTVAHASNIYLYVGLGSGIHLIGKKNMLHDVNEKCWHYLIK